jgi:hypothetical protein
VTSSPIQCRRRSCPLYRDVGCLQKQFCVPFTVPRAFSYCFILLEHHFLNRCLFAATTVFWVVTPCSSERPRRFGGKPLPFIGSKQAGNSAQLTVLIQVSFLAYSSSQEMEAICSSETSASPRTTRRCNTEDRTLG